MEGHAFLYGALGVFSLLTFASIIHMVSRWSRIPFAIGLLLGGILLSIMGDFFSFELFQYFHFSPEIVFYVFLPTLIFESAYHMNFRHFRGVFREVTVLATFGLIAAIGIIGIGLNYFLDIPIGVSFLFGSLISATDPAAVLAIFKEIHAPEKLETLVDGESLLNDATALVLFQFLLGAVVFGEINLAESNLWIEIFDFTISLGEGMAVGLAFGYIFSFAISKSKTKGVQLTLSLVLAHITFLVAEGLLGVSGVLATMIAAFVMGNYGRRKLQTEIKKSFTEIWKFLGFISNSLIFILLGLKIGEIDFSLYWSQILIAGALVLVLARPTSIYLSFFLVNLTRKSREKTTFPYQHVVMWGGIRGALGAAAVLLIPESFEYAQLLQAMTAGVILITFLVNGLTISTLVKKLKLIDFSLLEKIQQLDAKILINNEIIIYLKKLLNKKYISIRNYNFLTKTYNSERNSMIKRLTQIKKKSGNFREIEKLLYHYALGIEKRTYHKLFSLKEISEERFNPLLESILRQVDFLEADILPEERLEKKGKVAPKIPRNCKFKNFLNLFLSDKRIKKIFKKHQKKKVISRMTHYRARRIASWQVILDFEKLRENHSVFHNSKVISRILKKYKEWNKNSEIKIQEIKQEFPKITLRETLRMAEQECFRKEHQLEQEFFDKGFLNQKVFKEMEEDIEKKENICNKPDEFQ